MPSAPQTPTRLCPICDARVDAAMCPTDGVPTVRADFDAVAAHDPVIGSTVAGRFRVDAPLGEGASGRVYRATQLSIGRDIALKLLQPHHARDRRHVRRFYREARAATRLRSEHVVRVHDFGVDDETRTPFIAMELLRGETLRDRLGRGPLAPADAARVGAQIARALVAAADVGIVHRDLKPSNVMLVPTPDRGAVVKVTDFGIAKDLAQGDTETLTQHGAAIGTPAYMAPEQVDGGEVGPATDLYALGCVLYELLSGRPPFAGDARAGLLVDHLLTPVTPLKDAPADLGALVMQLLAKRPEDRPADARTVVAALDAIAAGDVVVDVARHRPGGARGPATEGDIDASPVATASPKPLGRRRWLWVATGLGGLGAVVATALVITGGGTVSAPPSITASGAQGPLKTGAGATGAAPVPRAPTDPGAAREGRPALPAPRAPAPTKAPPAARRAAPAPLASLDEPRPAAPDGAAAADDADNNADRAVDEASLSPLPAGRIQVQQLVARGAAATVHVHQGAAQPIRVVGDAALVGGHVDGRRLSLTVLAAERGRPRPEIHVWSPTWSSIKAGGAVTVLSAGRLQIGALSLGLSGSARATLAVDGDLVTTSLRGSSEARLSGAVAQHQARTGGASRLDARALVTRESSLAAAGTSEATLHATDSLDVRNEGAGEVTYLGAPPRLTVDGDGVGPAVVAPAPPAPP